MTLHVVLLALATGALGYAAWRVVTALGLRSAVEIMVGTLVIGCAAVVGCSLLIGGALGLYEPWALTGAALLIATPTVAVTLRPGPRERAQRARVVVRSGIGGAVRGLGRHPAVAVLALLVLAQYLWRLALGVQLPPMDWDGLSYHLIAPDTWILDGRIGRTQQTIWTDVYPLNVELLVAWPGVFLRTLRYAAVVQFPLFLLGALAVAGLARRVGARGHYAAIAALVYLAIPAAFVQASTTYVDVSSAAFALAALYLVTGIGGVATSGTRSVRAVMVYSGLSGAALGLAAGAKPSNLVFVPIVFIAALIQSARVSYAPAQAPVGDALNTSEGSVRRDPAPQTRAARLANEVVQRPVLAAGIALLTPLAALGTFWYFRTFLHYGNPFHPFTMLGFQGVGTVEDVIIRSNRPPELINVPWGDLGRLVRSWAEDFGPRMHQYDIRLGGFGMAWIVLVLPAAALALIAYLRRRHRTGPVLLLAATAALGLAASPAPWWPRYVLPALGICCGLAAITLSRIRRRPVRAVLQTTLVGLVATSMWWATNPTFVCQADVCHQRTLAVSEAVDLMRRPDRASLVWPWFDYRFLDELPEASTVALMRDSAHPFTHPFVGQDLQRRLTVVEAQTDVDGLARALTEANARYVVLSLGDATAPLARAASRDHRFKLRNTPEQRVNGADVFEFGHFPDVCTEPTGWLSLRVTRRTKTTVTLTTALRDTCGRPMTAKAIDLWTGSPTVPLWKQDKITQTAVTGADGRLSFTVPAPRRTTRYFVRYGGTDYVSPGASPPLHVEPSAPHKERPSGES